MFLQELSDNTFLNGAPGFLGNVDMLKKLMYGSQNDMINPPLEATPTPQDSAMQSGEENNMLANLQKAQLLQELFGEQEEEQENTMPSSPPMMPQQQYMPLLSAQKDVAFGFGKTAPKSTMMRRRFGDIYGSF